MLNKRLLYVVYGGWQNTIIDAQIIVPLQKLKELEPSINILLIFLCQSSDVYNLTLRKIKNENSDAVLDIKCMRILPPYLPFSFLVNNLLTLFALKQYECIKTIVARTELSGAYIIFFAQIRRVNLIWDCRGDLITEVYFEKRDTKLFRFLNAISSYKSKILKYQRLMLQHGFAAIFVSNSLRNLVRMRLGDIALPTHVFPCVVGENFLFNKFSRASIRAKMGIPDTGILIVYSGSMGSYHNGDQFWIDLASFLEQEDVYLLLLTKSKIDSENFLSMYRNKTFIKSVEYEDVPNYLSAADYAYFSRNCSLINYVASPVKLAEYAASGLRIIGDIPVKQHHEFFETHLAMRVLEQENLLVRQRRSNRNYEIFSSTNLIEIIRSYHEG